MYGKGIPVWAALAGLASSVVLIGGLAGGLSLEKQEEAVKNRKIEAVNRQIFKNKIITDDINVEGKSFINDKSNPGSQNSKPTLK